MADANRHPPIAHDASNPNTMMILTPDQRAVLTGLLVNAIMDTGSNRVAALYRGILTSLSQLSPCTIDITEEMALAGAKTLAAAIRMDRDGLHPGRVDSGIVHGRFALTPTPTPIRTITSISAAPSSPPASRPARNRLEQHRDLPTKVTRQELDQTIDELRAIGGVHLLPIMTAVRDYGIAFVQMLQDTGPVSFRFDRPTIILLGDDLHEAKAPPAFPEETLRAVLDSVSRVIIVANDAQPRFYALAATRAAIFREHVLIIATLPQHEADWCTLDSKIWDRIAHCTLQHTYNKRPPIGAPQFCLETFMTSSTTTHNSQHDPRLPDYDARSAL